MPVATPIINGFLPEWANIELNVKGQIYTGIKSIDFNTDSDGVDVMGTHPEAIARTLGTNKHTASFEMYLPDAAAFLAALGDGYRQTAFDVSVQFSMGDTVYQDVLVSCLIKTVTNSHSQGGDALTRKFDVRPFRIKRGASSGAFMVDIETEIQDPFAV